MASVVLLSRCIPVLIASRGERVILLHMHYEVTIGIFTFKTGEFDPSPFSRSARYRHTHM